MIVVSLNRSGYHELAVTSSRIQRVFPARSRSGSRPRSDFISPASLEFSIKRAKKNLKRILLNQNLEKASFLTLTYAENVQNRERVFKDFQRFIKRLRSIFKIEIKYTGVLEVQKRGAFHIHLILFGVPYLPADEIARLWGQGFIKINQIKGVKNVIKYLTKYITKDIEGVFCKYQKKYFASQGLFRGVKLVFNSDDVVGRFFLSYVQGLKRSFSDFFSLPFSYIGGFGVFWSFHCPLLNAFIPSG